MQPDRPAGSAGSAAAAGCRASGWRFLQAGDLKTADRELDAVALKTHADVLSRPRPRSATSRWRARMPKAALDAFRSRVAAPAGLRAGARRTGAGAAWRSNRERGGDRGVRAALAADPSLTDIARRVDVLKFRGLAAGARGGARRGARGPRRRGGPGLSRPRSRARPTARSCIASSRDVERAAGRRGRGARAFPHARRARSGRRAVARAARRASSRRRATCDGARRRRTATRSRSSRTPALAAQARRAPRAARAGAAAGGISRASIGAAGHARRSGRADRRPARAAAAGRARDAGVDHRHPRTLGRALDHGRSRVPASWSRLPNHTFQPRTVVRRVDLAQAVARLLSRIAAAQAGAGAGVGDARGCSSPTCRPATWPIRRPRPPSPPGVMTDGADGAFQPSRVGDRRRSDRGDRQHRCARRPAGARDDGRR